MATGQVLPPTDVDELPYITKLVQMMKSMIEAYIAYQIELTQKMLILNNLITLTKIIAKKSHFP